MTLAQQQQQITPSQSVELRSQQTKKAPIITRAPSPTRDVQVGQTTKLTVHIEAFPPPRFTWFGNGQAIKPSQRFKVNYEQGIITLMIFNVQKEDSGEYLFKASNEVGDVSCKTILNVQPTEKVVELPTQPQQAIPVFTQPLQHEMRVPIENNVARLECQVGAHQPPSITWHVNGTHIVPSQKYVISRDGSRSILEVRNLVTEDTGVYTCKAVTESGEAVSNTTLYVVVPEPMPQAPKFSTPLMDVQATDGKEVILTCVVQGQPKPDISWFHNGKNIDRSDDFVINHDRQTGKIDLVIVDCLPDDQGNFKCLATNPAGQASTECVLSVGPAPTEIVEMEVMPEVKVVAQAVVPEEATRKLSVESSSSRTSTDSVKVIKKVVKRTSGTPPKFIKPIQPCVVREGDTCSFTATITGAPQPEITWLKDKAEMAPNDRFVPHFDADAGVCTLTIKDAKPEDVGVYSCRATNLAGRATCTANVVVVPPNAEVTITEKTVSVKKEKVTLVGEQETRTVESSPTFKSTLVPVTEVNPGDNVRFECQATSEPPPNLKWYHNGLEVTPTKRFNVTLIPEQFTTCLTIQNVCPADTGEYICKATNTLGESITKTFLRLKQPEPEPEKAPAPVEEGVIEPEMKPKIQSSPQDKPDPRGPVPLSEPCAVIPLNPVEEPPRFTMPLRNQSVNDGDQCVMRVVYLGYPSPQITWFFNSQLIDNTKDFQIKVDRPKGESSLAIVEVFPEDEGEYMCKAENTLGTAVTHCHLFVRLPSSSSDDDVEKLVSTTQEVVRVQQPIEIKETRRFSETISIDMTKTQQQPPTPTPRQTTPQVTEFFVRQTSLPRGMKMEVEVPVPRQVMEKRVELKQKTEAVSTQRQEMKIQLANERRFSETLAIDHKKQHTIESRKISTSTLSVKQKAALRGMKMNVEVPELTHRTSLDVKRRKQVDALETKRQELVMMLEGAPPKFLWNIQSQKVMDGEKVKFFTQVTGTPKPEVTWYHNGKVIIDNPDFHSVYNKPTGDCTLYIIEVFPQDTGTYECVAVNPYGRAETKAQLVVEVHEYMPDSEEATASDMYSASSMDEGEYQKKTQMFLTNMEKLRNEIQEDTTKTEFEEEIVEELEVEEQGFEETIQMADVKWQIPKKGQTHELSVENTQETSTTYTTEQTLQKEVVRDVEKASVIGAKPSRVVTQLTKASQEDTMDLFATGADMTQQQEIEVELAHHRVEMKPESRVEAVDQKPKTELAEELVSSSETEQTHQQEIIIDLATPMVEDKKPSHVEQVQTQASSELTADFTDAPFEMSTQQEILIDLAQHDVQPKKETMTVPMEEKNAPEVAEELVGEAGEAMQQEDYQIELAQPDVAGKKETQTLPVEEQVAPETISSEINVYLDEKSEQQEVVIELNQPTTTGKQESLVAPVEEKQAPEEAQELIGEAGEAMQQEDYTVEFAQPDVEGKKETQTVPMEENVAPESVSTEISIQMTETTTEQQIVAELTQPTVDEKKESLVAPIEELNAPEEAQDLIGEAGEAMQEDDYQVELAQHGVEGKKETQTQPIEEQVAPEQITSEISMETSETTQEQEIIVELTQPDVEQKKESLVAPIEEKNAPEEAQELIGEAGEAMQEQDYNIELAKPEVEDKKETSTVPVEEEVAPEQISSEITIQTSEQTQEHEIVVELAQPGVEDKRESLVAPVEEKNAPEEAQELIGEAGEALQEQDYSVELAEPSVQEKQETQTQPIEEQVPEEAHEELTSEVTETTQEQEIVVEFTEPKKADRRESMVSFVEEKVPEEAHEELIQEVTDTTQEEQIVVEMGQSEKEEKQPSMVAPVEEQVAEEGHQEIVQEQTDTTQEEEIVVELAQSEKEDKQLSLVAPVEEQVAEEGNEELVQETTDTTQEEEIVVELAQPEKEDKQPSLVAPVEEQVAEEGNEELVQETTDTTQEEEIVVELAQSEAEKKEPSMVAPVEEQVEAETPEDIVVESTDTTQEESIVVDLAQPGVEDKITSLVAPVEEKVAEEGIEDVAQFEIDMTKEEEIQVVEFDQPSGKDITQTHVQPQEEPLREETAETVDQLSEETTHEEEILVDLAEPKVEQSKPSHAATQIQKLTPEVTDTVITELTSESTEGQEITIELDTSSSHVPQESMVATQVAKLTEEEIADMKEDAPSPKITEGEEVEFSFVQPEMRGEEPSHAAAQDEVLSEGSLEEHMDVEAAQFMHGEEITVDLARTDVPQKETSHVGFTIEILPAETEEELFFLAPEPSADSEEIAVEMSAAEIKPKEQTLVLTQETGEKVEITEGEVAEFIPEETKEEEVVVLLGTVECEEARPAQVTLQEAVTEPLKTDDLQTEEITKDMPEESQVEMEYSVAEPATRKESMVKTVEEKLDLMMTKDDIEVFHEHMTMPEQIEVDLEGPEDLEKPVTHVEPIQEGVMPENIAEEYIGSIKEVRMIPGDVHPEYEPMVMERYRLEARVNPQEVERQQEIIAHMKQLDVLQLEQLESQSAIQIVEKDDTDMRGRQEIVEEVEVVVETVREEIEIKEHETHISEVTVIKDQETVVSAVSLMAPAFEIPLSDVTVTDGEKATLECRVTGIPQPQVTWFVDTQEIKPSTDFQITYNEGVCTLVILDVLPEDEGEYTVKAVNEAGTCVTTAYLTVLPASRPESDYSSAVEETTTITTRSERREKVEFKREITTREVPTPDKPQAPYFITKLEPKEIFESMPVTLYCEVSALPMAEITWYQDGKKVTACEHMQMDYQRGVCRLFIDKVTIEDEAEYTCEAVNEHGVATTIAELLVEKMIGAVEQVVSEEFYEIEVEMYFKWRSLPECLREPFMEA